jgi:hypothetical protein
MKKPLKPARKNGLETDDKNEEIIDLKDVVNQNHESSDQKKEDILDLTNKISSKEQERPEAGVIELTESIPPHLNPVEGKDDLNDVEDRSSNNVIHLAEKTSGLSTDESDDIEELSHEDIMELDEEDIHDLEDENLDRFAEEFESAISDSLDDDNDIFNFQQDANIAEGEDIDGFDQKAKSDDEDEKDDIDGFDLLSEVESDMDSKIDAIDVKELNDETTFKDIGSALKEELNDPDDDFSETAVLSLNRAMEADRDSAFEEDDEVELLEEIEEVRDTLDNVFFEEDSQDSLFAINAESIYDPKDEPGDELAGDELIEEPKGQPADQIEEFNSEELIPQPFGESESDALPNSLDDTSFKAEDTLKDSLTKTGQTNLFDVDVNVSNTKTSEDRLLQDQIKPFEAELTISNNEIESAVRHLIEGKYGKKIEQMIIETIEKIIVHEITKIKKAFLDKSGSIDGSQDSSQQDASP